MLTINYKNILTETITSYKKHAIVNLIFSSIFVIFLLLLSVTLYFFKDNSNYYYISTVIVMLVLFYLTMLLKKLALESSKNKIIYKDLIIKPIEFSNFVLNLLLQLLAYFVVSIPSIIAGFVLLIAFNNQIMPFDKTNFSFDDTRLAISGVTVYLFSFLIILLINIPFILYTFVRVGFGSFYIFDKNSNYSQALTNNIEDTKDINFLNIATNILFFLVLEIIIVVAITITSSIFTDGNYQGKYQYLLIAILPIIAIPFLLIQLSNFYKKLSQQKN